MRLYQRHLLWALLALSVTTTSGCAALSPRAVPPDFMFILDAQCSDGQRTRDFFIRTDINARGQGHFERYDPGGEIYRDETGIVVYDKDQVVESGDFKLRSEQVRQLWQTVKKNNLFELRGDYRSSIGRCYAFVKIKADGQTHQIFNIGPELPEIKAVLEKLRSMLPAGVAVSYDDCAN